MLIKKTAVANSLIWLSVTLFYCYQYILRTLPNVVMQELMRDFNISSLEFGHFAGIYYIGYIIAHIPIGLMLARFGGKIVLPVCILLTSLGLLPLLYNVEWNYVVYGRLITGIGSSAAIVGVLQIFRTIFPAHFTKITGFTVFFGLVTAVYASPSLMKVINNIGIFFAVKLLIISGIILAVGTFFLIPAIKKTSRETGALEDLRKVLTNKNIIIISLLSGLMVGPLEGFSDAWGTGFLSAVHGIRREIANSIVASIYTGMCFGCIALPYLADRTQRYYSITIISGIMMLSCFIYFLKAQDASPVVLNILCVIIGIFCAYQVVIVSKVSSFAPERLSGTAAAVSNMIIMAFGSFFHGSIGYVMEHSPSNQIIDGVKIYSSQSYISSISIIPMAIAVALVGFLIFVIMGRGKTI